MNRVSKWKQDSFIVIEQALRHGVARGLSGKELVQHVDDAYPFGERRNHPFQCWRAVRREMLGNLLPDGKGRPHPVADPNVGVDRDYFAKLDGPGSPAWEAMLVRKRGELAAAGIEADEWTDEAVADWRPAAKEVTGR